MICKHLERKISFFTEEIDEGYGYDFDLEYYLVESEEKVEDNEMVVYGLEIIKKYGEKTESKMIRNYSSSMENVRKLISELADHTVTPVSLPFVLDDILGV